MSYQVYHKIEHCMHAYSKLDQNQILHTGQIFTYTTEGFMVDGCRIVHVFHRYLSYTNEKMTFPIAFPLVA